MGKMSLASSLPLMFHGQEDEQEGRASVTFHADPDPKPGQRAELQAFNPANPLYHSLFQDAMAAMGRQPWVLTLRQEGEVVSASPAFLKTGRLNSTFSIPSLPSLVHGKTFWDGIMYICTTYNITILSINCIASSCDPIPPLTKEMYRKPHHEYVIDLRKADLWKAYSENLKRNIKRARKSGLQIQRAVEDVACHEHMTLIRHSLDRRQRRGEDDVSSPDRAEMIALIRSGIGEFFQCVGQDGAVLSSILVLTAERGAIYHTGGTSPEGMACGASPFLLHEVIDSLRAKDKDVFYLGSAAPGCSLQHFKASFGAKPIQGESAEFLVGGRFRFGLGRFAQWLSESPAPLLRRFLPRPGTRARDGS